MPDQVNCGIRSGAGIGNGLQQAACAGAQAGGGQRFHAVDRGRHVRGSEQIGKLALHRTPVSEITEVGEAKEAGNQE